MMKKEKIRSDKKMSKTIKISVCLAALMMILCVNCGSACADYGFSSSTKSDYGYEQAKKSDYGYVEATKPTDATNIGSTYVPDTQLNGNRDYYFCRNCGCNHHNSYNPNHYVNYQQQTQVQKNQPYHLDPKKGNPQALYQNFKNR